MQGALPLIDAHAHLFTPGIMRSMAGRPAVLSELALDVEGASGRLAAADLDASASAAGVSACLILPTAPPDGVREANESTRAAAAAHPRLAAASTLHPHMPDPGGAIREALERTPRAIKLSSFTQRFDPLGEAATVLFERIQVVGAQFAHRPTIVLDTYTRAAAHFRCEPEHVTTPGRLARLVRRFPGLDWVGAHMGGLAAPADDLRRHLPPAANLYLDTSNAAHVLAEDDFVDLLRIHGPGHVMFGTDWPWFPHHTEIPKIRRLLTLAGFDRPDRARVLHGNAARLYGI